MGRLPPLCVLYLHMLIYGPCVSKQMKVVKEDVLDDIEQNWSSEVAEPILVRR